MRDLTYFVAASIDGFIAGPGGEYDSFLAEGDHMAAVAKHFSGTVPTAFAEQAGVPAHGGPFDTVLMGWNTYAVGLPHLPSPYSHLRQIVFTRTHAAPEGSADVQFTHRDPVEVVGELKSAAGSGIWLCGGGALAARLADEIDHLVLKISPVLLGDGIRLFGDRPYAPRELAPRSVRAFESGVVIAQYSRA